MSNTGNKYKVGLLFILSTTLLVFGLFSLGLMQIFREKYEFMTVVESSVQGLDKGSKVKLKGVTVGQVSKIQISEDNNLVYIFMDFDPYAFDKSSVKNIKIIGTKEASALFEKQLKIGVEKGLRCQMQYGGITGDMYIELSFFDPKTLISKDYKLPEDHPPYIPSIPTPSIENVLDNIQKATKKISEVDFIKISKEIEDFLSTARELMNNRNIESTMQEVNEISINLKQISENIKDSVTKKKIDEILDKIDKTFENVNQTVLEIQDLAKNARKEVLDSKFPKTTEDARELMLNSNHEVIKFSELREQLVLSLRKLDQTLQAAEDLFNYIEQNPSSILKGKSGEPVISP